MPFLLLIAFASLTIALPVRSSHAADDAHKPYRVPADWTVIRKILRQPAEIDWHAHAAFAHRLILQTEQTEVSPGENLRFYCAVGNISAHNEPLLNPFSETAFPRNIAILIYDNEGNFLHSLSVEDSTPTTADDRCGVSLRRKETRGKLVQIAIAKQGNSRSTFSVELQPGIYQFQLVACARFFMGGTLRHDPNAIREKEWGTRPNLEEARSELVSVTITAGPPPPPEIEPELDEPPKLLASLQIKDIPFEEPRGSSFRQQYVLTLKNTSITKTIGVIDPFSRGLRPPVHPVRWIEQKVGGFRHDSGQRPVPDAWVSKRSDFVILPPQGISSCRIGGVPITAGKYEISVDLLNGIVIDSEKLEILRNGDPELGWMLGGDSSDVLHPLSIVRQKVVVK